MKLSSAILLAQASAELQFDDLAGNTARQERTLGNLSAASANKISSVQAGGKFPHVNDILYTQSQAQMFASLGMAVPAHQISSAPAWKEQLETNGNARGLANTVLDGRLWTQHPYPSNCDFETNSQCKYLVPFYYAAGTTTQARERISAAMANIESKTCLRFQFLSNPGHSTYLNKKKLRVVTTTNLCASYVGANYQEQEIYLSQNPADNCGLNATAVEHEILHAIGLYHENQRPDVEKFLSYNWANIRQDMTQQQINTDYGVIPEAQFLDFDSSFDFNSIMLIGSTDNARPCTNADGSICETTVDTSVNPNVYTMCSDTCSGTNVIKSCDLGGVNAVHGAKNVCDYYPALGGYDGTAASPAGNYGTGNLWSSFGGTGVYADLGMINTVINCGGAAACTDEYTCSGDCAAPHPSLVAAGLPGGFDPATYQTYMRVYTKIDSNTGNAYKSELGTAYNLATSLSDDDAWQINSLYGCTAYKKEYMHKCSNGRYEMTHSFGMDLKCNERQDMCPAQDPIYGGSIDWTELQGSLMGGDGSDESECHACAVGQHSCDTKATCQMAMGPLGAAAADILNTASAGTIPCAVTGACADGDIDIACSSSTALGSHPLFTCLASDSYPSCSCDVTPKATTPMLNTINTIENPTMSTGVATDYLKGNGNTIASGGTGCIDVNECVDVAKCRFSNADYNLAYDGAMSSPPGTSTDAEIRLPCINHDPGFECVCPQGQVHPDPYTENAFQHLEECVDENECETGNHECPSSTICHNLFCEGNSFFGKPCGYGEGYVCACPFNTHLSTPVAYDISNPGGTGVQAVQCVPTDAHAIPSEADGCTKYQMPGAQGILHPEHPDFATDIGTINTAGRATNVAAIGTPATGFTCPNMNQCGANTVVDATGAARTSSDVYSAYMYRDQCLLCKSTGLPVLAPDGTLNSNCIDSSVDIDAATYHNLKWYDPGTICLDHDDSIPGQPTHSCRCPKGAAPEYYTHSFFSQFDMDDGVLDGKINLTQGLLEKGWFDITAYIKNQAPMAAPGPASTAPDGSVGAATLTYVGATSASVNPMAFNIEKQLFASGFTTQAPLTAGTVDTETASLAECPFLNANTGNTAYGIQYSSQSGNNWFQPETFPSTLGQVAFFIVRYDAGNWLTIL